ncbi:MAG: DUF5615 family PIN-like protein [Dehalococcoidia bacterium]|nr:DUF5615 family PIN-like protein [Dehalococcoidia bacterium]
MRFLVDAALSPAVALGLRGAGHDAVHLVDLGMLQANDTEVLLRALSEDRVVVSADTDFGMLLATRKDTRPSLILFRHPIRSPQKQVRQILGNLHDIEGPLDEGSIVVVEESRVRIRRLPIGESTDDA